MTKITIAALLGMTLAALTPEALGQYSDDELAEGLIFEGSDEGQKRKGAVEAIEAEQLRRVEAADKAAADAAAAAAAAKNTEAAPAAAIAATPDWQAPDYAGPLHGEQALWRMANLKSATNGTAG